MRRKINVEVRRERLACCVGLAFSNVEEWCWHISRDLKMDIIYPEASRKAGSAARHPCVLWICGGGWLDMSRSAHLPYLAYLARHGFAVASAEYRTSNVAPYPAALKDIKAAIRYLRANADRYNIDGERIGVMGESAGGYLAAMAALNSSPDLDEGAFLECSSSVQAACAWYPPADFSKMPPWPDGDAASPMSLFMGKNSAANAEYTMAISPVSFVSAEAPPFLIMHGNGDTTVPLACSESLYDKLIAAGCDAELVEIEGARHAGIAFFQDKVWDAIAAFFSEKLSSQKRSSLAG